MHNLLNILMVLCFCCTLLVPHPSASYPRKMSDLQHIAENMLRTPIKGGSIHAIFKPEYTTVSEAWLSMEHEEAVFIVQLPDGIYIYPQIIMAWHQVVNENINDFAYIITYCPMTGTMGAYDASKLGVNLLFDVDGRLYDGNSVLVDRNTRSLWLQELGICFAGPFAGRGLPRLRAFWTNWGAAARAFPNAKVLNAPKERKAYRRDPYGSYQKKGTYYDNDETVYRLNRIDRRLHKKTPMYCLELGDQVVAIDIGYVKKKGVVNFYVGPYALVAVHDVNLDVIRIYDRKVWAEPFLFVFDKNRFVDLATKTSWNVATGKAIQGSMAGSTLKQFYGYYSMWMAWASMNPEGAVIPGQGEVSEHLLNSKPIDSSTTVPTGPIRRKVKEEQPF